MRPFPRILLLPILAGLLFVGWHSRLCAQDKLLEHEVKAAFLYNFGKFVQWPASAFTSEDEPLRIGIWGSSPVGDELKRLSSGKTIQNRKIEIVESRDIEKLKTCHIVFFASHFEHDGFAILQTMQSMPILTVGECEHFLPEGGTVRFFLEDNKVKFTIEAANLEKTGLVASSKLLKVANISADTTRRQ